MTDREKLIDMLESVEHARRLYPDLYVDMLIANGVVVREKGEWVEHYNEGYEMWFYDCPFCDDGYSMKQRDKSKPNFCHNCGADMRIELALPESKTMEFKRWTYKDGEDNGR